jgi:hypothetical protein
VLWNECRNKLAERQRFELAVRTHDFSGGDQVAILKKEESRPTGGHLVFSQQISYLVGCGGKI